MSTTVKPTTGTPPFTTDELTVIVASLSCLLFLLVIMVVLCLLYRRDPLCCKVREYHESHTDLATNPQYYSSTQTLVGPACSQHMSHENTHRQQSDSLFLIGLPSSYGLPSLAVPRLPSYESVRKKDRQRQIHMLIADRFGLNGPYISEPPPSYEESVRHSVEIPCGVIGPLHDPSDVIGPSEVSCDAIGPFQAPGDVIGPSEVSCDVIGPSEVSCDAIGPFQAPGDVIGPLAMAGSSSPPCDMTGALDTCCDIISPLPAPCDMIGTVNAPPHGIGPLNAPPHGIGPVSELPETHP
ncbi:uncharacterized protein LOC143137484 isoform X1 [Alosa pseudoharengus]|uniref:uncharacterized protein LOC143137484 isoform X1 n=1 Tax=Alosa pseudoharengus TaxID=34774 RepID=UPI003F8BF1BE